MARGLPSSWKETAVSLAIGAVLLFIFLDDRFPTWLRASIGILIIVAPVLPFLVLLPWHFIARSRGLAPRSDVPCVVSLSEGGLHVQRGDKRTSHVLDLVARARFARNDNWTESKMLEDALGLFTAKGREIERLPESATGLDELQRELGARGIPIEDVEVSAPAFLD
ncbi:hypothetical protein [Polyangium mundeleinium]|uniref:Uncharacterized protein n=1 Tax=Polyangium mundeleinium TaxID=2995306 RepID=A0ABT5ELS7_9BACT|nr:hypothetical protein [Polyangium mundeleinium]MDC0742793.1 hypothetical protein [Polyangium mundeleinium]